jgi:hypothetical protein
MIIAPCTISRSGAPPAWASLWAPRSALDPQQNGAEHAGSDHEADGRQRADPAADYHKSRDLQQRKDQDEEGNDGSAHGAFQKMAAPWRIVDR